MLLIALSAGACLLALFQWMELRLVEAGGTPLCALSETVDCGAVWSSPLAQQTHQLARVPIAGLGLAWGLAAFALSLLLTHRRLAGRSTADAALALRLTAAAGVLACLVLAAASLQLGAVCLTCLGTYALVLGFAVAALRLPGPVRPARGSLRPALLWTGGLTSLAYLAVLGPALATPPPGEHPFPPREEAQGADPRAVLERYLAGLSTGERRELGEWLAYFKDLPAQDAAFPARERRGAPEAPVRIVDFTDTRCTHCAALAKTLEALERALPEGLISLESRQFPLARECNPALTDRPDPSGVRCASAKAQICLEGTPRFWTVRAQLFAEQEQLTVARVLELASAGGQARDALVACMQSEATRKKLDEDIAYAQRYQISGTPLLLVNGKQAMPDGVFLYALAMTRGDASSPAFSHLPPPRPPPAP